MATLRSEVLGPHSPSGRTAWSRRADLFTALARIHGDADTWTLFADLVGGRPRDTLVKIRQVTGWDRTPVFAHLINKMMIYWIVNSYDVFFFMPIPRS